MFLLLLVNTSYLNVSVREEQVHDDVLRQDFSVVDAEFDSGKFLCQLLPLIFLSGFSYVVQQRVLKGGTEEKQRTTKR